MAAARPKSHRESSQHHRGTARYKRELRLLGAKVRSLRHEADWTLEEAAERCDLDWRYLQKVEAGTLNFTFVTLVRLAVGFRQPIHILFLANDVGTTLEPRRPGRPRKKTPG